MGFSLLAAPLTGRAERDVYTPLADVGDAFDQLRDGLDPGRREEVAEATRAAARSEYALDRRTLAALERGSVAIEPWEATAAWAYDLDWRPLPVFQSYGAYTPELDQINAEALAASDGPDLVLRHLGLDGVPNASIDGRYAPFDAPATTRGLLCGFRAVRTTDRYQVLERAPDRCGPEVAAGDGRGALQRADRGPADRAGRAAVRAHRGTRAERPRPAADDVLQGRPPPHRPRRPRLPAGRAERRRRAPDLGAAGPGLPGAVRARPEPGDDHARQGRRLRLGTRHVRGRILQGTGEPMILYGCAVTDGETFARCAEPGIRRLTDAEPGAEMLAQPSAGSVARNYNLLCDARRRARRPGGAGARAPGRRDRRSRVLDRGSRGARRRLRRDRRLRGGDRRPQPRLVGGLGHLGVGDPALRGVRGRRRDPGGLVAARRQARLRRHRRGRRDRRLPDRALALGGPQPELRRAARAPPRLRRRHLPPGASGRAQGRDRRPARRPPPLARPAARPRGVRSRHTSRSPRSGRDGSTAARGRATGAGGRFAPRPRPPPTACGWAPPSCSETTPGAS